MKYILTAFLLFITYFSFCENPCGLMSPRETYGTWGNGGLYIPRNVSLTIYNKNLTKVGTINRGKNNYTFKNLSKKEIQIDRRKDLEYIGHYEYSFIKAKEGEENGYLEVFMNSNYNQEFKCFVNLNEVFDANGDYCTYREMLLSENLPEELLKGKSMASIGINLSTICLNLRKLPKLKSPKISCFGKYGLNGLAKLFEIESEGKWIKVEIDYCKKENIDNSDMDEGGCGGCCCKIKEDEYTGWMKAISENGFPNIWYSVTSY